MLENQTADSHISEVGTAQTASGNQTEAVGEQTVASSGSQTEDSSAKADFEAEMNAMWGLPSEEAEGAPAEVAEEEAPAEEKQAEETAETEESEEELEEPAETEQETETSPDTMTLNFMGQKLDMPLDQVKELAERGMNVDRLNAKYDKLKPLESILEPLETMAHFYGTPMEEFVKGIASMESLKQGEIQRLTAQGLTEEAALEVFQAKYEAAKAKGDKKSPSEQGLSQIQKEQITAFQRLRPDVDKQIQEGMKLPDDVVKNWSSGVPLTESWLLHEIEEAKSSSKELKDEIKTLKKERDKLKKDLTNLQKNNENKAKAPISKKGTGGGSGHENPFSGWDQF